MGMGALLSVGVKLLGELAAKLGGKSKKDIEIQNGRLKPRNDHFELDRKTSELRERVAKLEKEVNLLEEGCTFGDVAHE